MTFKPAYAGAKNTYLLAVDVSGTNSGWQQLGAWTVPTPTQPGQPPTAPSNLSAAAASASQIDLSWTASTSNVGAGKLYSAEMPRRGLHQLCANCYAGRDNLQRYGPAWRTPVTRYQVQAIDTVWETSPLLQHCQRHHRQ